MSPNASESRYPWSDAPEWAMFAATDWTGHWWWYDKCPTASTVGKKWGSTGSNSWRGSPDCGHTADWRDSLEPRPAAVEAGGGLAWTDEDAAKPWGCEVAFLRHLADDPAIGMEKGAMLRHCAKRIEATRTHEAGGEVSGLKFVVDPTVPEGEAVFRDDRGREVGRITNIAPEAQSPVAAPFGHYFRDMRGDAHFFRGAFPPAIAQTEITPLYAAPVPASGEVGEDAALVRAFWERAEWVRQAGETFLSVRVANGADLSCVATRRAALTAALNGGAK